MVSGYGVRRKCFAMSGPGRRRIESGVQAQIVVNFHRSNPEPASNRVKAKRGYKIYEVVDLFWFSRQTSKP